MMGRLVWALVYCVRHSEQLFIIVLVCSVVHDNKVVPMGDETGDCLLAEAGFSAHVSIEWISQDSYWIYSVMSHLCIYQKQPDCNTDEWAVQGLMEDNVTAFEETYLFIYIYVSFFPPLYLFVGATNSCEWGQGWRDGGFLCEKRSWSTCCGFRQFPVTMSPVAGEKMVQN